MNRNKRISVGVLLAGPEKTTGFGRLIMRLVLRGLRKQSPYGRVYLIESLAESLMEGRIS